jgi:hypothetical protein
MSNHFRKISQKYLTAILFDFFDGLCWFMIWSIKYVRSNWTIWRLLKHAMETIRCLNGISISEIRCFQLASTVSSNCPIGLDLTYLMLYIMNQYNPSQISTKFAAAYFLWIFSRTDLTWDSLGSTLATDDSVKNANLLFIISNVLW